MSLHLRLSFMLLAACVAGCVRHPPAEANLPPAKSATQDSGLARQAGSVSESGPLVQTGRYSFVQAGARPAQVDPLLAVIDVSLPPEVATVEQAVDYVLRRSGFNLLPAPPGDEAVGYLLGQPLPEVHRHLGPITLRDALATLGGKAFNVNVDYVYRKIGYQVSSDYFKGQRS